MKKIWFCFLITLSLNSCYVAQGWQSYSIQEPSGRTYLKDMAFKKSFTPEMAQLIDENSVYYRYDENLSIDFKLHSGIRFFNTGQYIGYGSSEELDYSILTEAKRGGIGYYNADINDSIIIIEAPNFLFRRSGKSNLDKYKVLSNGDLKGITRQASDYGAVYRKIKLPESLLKGIKPDW